MHNRTAKLLSAAGAGVIAGLAVLAVPYAAIADDCLAAPNAASPAGSHWYYRSDHAKQRKCWYLRKVDAAPMAAKPAATASADATDDDAATTAAPVAAPSAAAAPTAAPVAAAKPVKPASRNAAATVPAPLTPSIADARAEYLAPPEPAPLRDTAAAAPLSPFPAPVPAVTTTTSAPAATAAAAEPAAPAPTIDQRWSDAASPASPPPADITTRLRKAAAQSANSAAPLAAEAASGSPPWALLGALLAALALAGVIGGTIVKLNRRAPIVRRDRHDIWGPAIDGPKVDIAASPRDLDIGLDRFRPVPAAQPAEPTLIAEPPAWIQVARRRLPEVDAHAEPELDAAGRIRREPHAEVQSAEEIEQLLALAQKRSAA